MHPIVDEMDDPDSFLSMLGLKGQESEAAIFAALRSSHEDSFVDLSRQRGSVTERVGATRAALTQRPTVIYQAPLAGNGFYGVADFLVRINETSDGTETGRYMVWDAKLGRHPRPSHVLQLCCYSEMLSQLQDAPVHYAGLILGASPLVVRLESYNALFRQIRARFLKAQETFDGSLESVPIPCVPRSIEN